jgi:hypothetical protein
MRALPSPDRRELLRQALPTSVAALHRRLARDIPVDDIDDYVRLNWLEWSGGGLKLTTTGENICRQLDSQLQ